MTSIKKRSIDLRIVLETLDWLGRIGVVYSLSKFLVRTIRSPLVRGTSYTFRYNIQTLIKNIPRASSPTIVEPPFDESAWLRGQKYRIKEGRIDLLIDAIAWFVMFGDLRQMITEIRENSLFPRPIYEVPNACIL